MKFGQMLGIPSVDRFEGIKDSAADGASESLVSVAEEMACFFRDNLDGQRFPWIANPQHRDWNSFFSQGTGHVPLPLIRTLKRTIEIGGEANKN